MTEAPHSPLVERAAKAIATSIYRSEGLETMNYAGEEDYCRKEWKHYDAEAQAVLSACHADEMRELLLRLEACHLGDRTFDEEAVYGVWRDACALLAKAEHIGTLAQPLTGRGSVVISGLVVGFGCGGVSQPVRAQHAGIIYSSIRKSTGYMGDPAKAVGSA